ncbi:MAG: ABC transporter ATP-binding protein [Treponema sp.]
MNVYKRLFKYVPEKTHCAYISAVLATVSAVLSMLPYWYLWKFLHALVAMKNYEGSKHYAVVIVGMMIAQGLIYFAALWASHLLAFRLETNLKIEGINHLMNASFAFFDTNASGTIRKTIDDNTQETHMIVAHLIPDNINAFLTPFLMIAVMFAVDYRLGILLIVVTIIGALQVRWMFGEQSFMKIYKASLDRMNAEAVEYVRGMQVIKIFRSTVQSFKNFYDSIMTYSKYSIDYVYSCRTPYVIFQVIFNIIIALSVPFAIIYINKGAPVQEILVRVIFFAAFGGLMFSALMRVMYVGMYQMQAQMVVDKFEEIFESMKKDKPEHGTRETFDNFDIEFKNVSFKYAEDYVLKDVSFNLSQHKTYALVGSSGGGKSTIAKLISGFYKINEGTILIGGHGISEYSEKALLSNIAFVFQNAKLFKTSIFENVHIGNPAASRDEVMKALEEAQCGDILNKFPERENTVIGSKGVHLSGGEMQRIAIARAILKNANIIILDEASAAADPENEYEIQQAFSNLMKNKTVIMIAHRLSSIRNVDEILVIDGGSVAERGSDAELMQKGGKYCRLQEMYSKANEWRV